MDTELQKFIISFKRNGKWQVAISSSKIPKLILQENGDEERENILDYQELQYSLEGNWQTHNKVSLPFSVNWWFKHSHIPMQNYLWFPKVKIVQLRPIVRIWGCFSRLFSSFLWRLVGISSVSIIASNLK